MSTPSDIACVAAFRWATQAKGLRPSVFGNSMLFSRLAVFSEPTELARNKPTAQSSTRGGSGGDIAAKAVDGLESTDFHDGGCTHTNPETDPWWRVDLKDRYEVFKVAIVNRGDCCGDRLDGFQLTVGKSLALTGDHE